MANVLYGKGRQKFLEGSIAWLTDTIMVVLVDTNGTTPYTYNSAHEFLSDVPGAAQITPNGVATLASKTSTLGVADAADVTMGLVSGQSAEALVIYKWTGSAGTSPLIAYIDSAVGLPVLPNGGDITIVWDNGANKIFSL